MNHLLKDLQKKILSPSELIDKIIIKLLIYNESNGYPMEHRIEIYIQKINLSDSALEQLL